ncbi:FAD-dependent oxidoreductase [Arthrobacter globiformis]|uniref:FAD-dependent oxidoreductase n=1 Tax=Arthrobacter globiformis TaxID=1665 RepID=UPI000B40C64F
MNSQVKEMQDVIVVGGGAAGLSAAMMLARSRRSVVVVDAGSPRNAPADGVHGLLGRDGMSPLELLSRGREEARCYGAGIVDGEVTDVSHAPHGFTVTLRSGDVLHGHRLLIATGLVDELPDIPGVRERWGRDVLHCPYCHGWEVRDRRIGVIASGPMSVHQALMFRQLSDQVTFFAQDHGLDAGDRARFDALGIAVITGRVAAVEVQNDRITGVLLADGTPVDVEVVVVAPRMVARSELFAGVGIQATVHPAGAFIETDEFGATSVPGVWAAGNSSDLSAQVGAAAAAGARAAQHINALMVTDDADRAVAGHVTKVGSPAPDHDHTPTHSFDKDYWEQHWQEGPGFEARNAVNPHLLREVGGLAAGSALDAGCGTGAEAIWLASRGWQVTAADISAAALNRASAHASATENPEVSGRVQWTEADLENWEPGRTFDLVTTHYAHPTMPQLDFYDRIASWVAPGGTLLIVGHRDQWQDQGHNHGHSHDDERGHQDHPPAKATATAAAITARLDPAVWDVVTADEVSRTLGNGGREVNLHDVIVRARRCA